MRALGGNGVMRSGVGAIRSAFEPLHRGLTAHQERVEGTPSAVHGVISPRPEELDPRLNSTLVVSASRLESLGSCPLRYLQSSVLRIYPPDDPELDPDRWLDPLRKGNLLHRVYEATLREAREQGISLEDAGLERLALEELDAAIESARIDMPVPGEGTLRRERIALREDVRSFVRMIRAEGAPWVALELTFGLAGDEPVILELDGGPVRLRGAIDRVDEDLEGVRVVDYKTGRAHGFDAETGSFNGGRRLQHALYALAAEARIGGAVVRGEYHFPTRRGENEVFSFDRVSLGGVQGLLGHMLDGVAEGSFVPTDEPRDCSYCDYAEVCRVRKGDWGNLSSPMADWSREHLNTGLGPAHANLKRARTYEE